MIYLSQVNRILTLLISAGCCCAASLAYADSRCGEMDTRTAKFVESIQKHASKTASDGRFQVKPVDVGRGTNKFDISYMIGQAEKFHVRAAPSTKNDEDFSFSSFRSKDGGALMITVGFGGSDGFLCGYLIHTIADRFRFEKIEGVFDVVDVNRDGLDEITVYERQDSADRCDANTSWRRIYMLGPSGGKLVDASKEFPSYYADLEKGYRKEKAQYEGGAGQSKKECQQQFDAIIRRANALAGGKGTANTR